jgi:hypothetical protein
MCPEPNVSTSRRTVWKRPNSSHSVRQINGVNERQQLGRRFDRSNDRKVRGSCRRQLGGNLNQCRSQPWARLAGSSRCQTKAKTEPNYVQRRPKMKQNNPQRIVALIGFAVRHRYCKLKSQSKDPRFLRAGPVLPPIPVSQRQSNECALNDVTSAFVHANALQAARECGEKCGGEKHDGLTNGSNPMLIKTKLVEPRGVEPLTSTLPV